MPSKTHWPWRSPSHGGMYLRRNPNKTKSAVLGREDPRPRRRKRPLATAWCFSLLLVVHASHTQNLALGQRDNENAHGNGNANGNAAHHNPPQCRPPEATRYDWERLNYYEILGLAADGSSIGDKKKKKKRKKTGGEEGGEGTGSKNSALEGVSNKEIRKAYRKQAQKFHPDKQAAKKKNALSSSSGGGGTSSESISVEESNARFAKIAEAYEFLTDENKRKDYDLFLEYCQNTQLVKDHEAQEVGLLATILKKRFGGLFEFVATRDPFSIFEEFFFGEKDDEENTDRGYFDPNDPFSHLRYTKSNLGRNRHHGGYEHQYHPEEEEDPVRVFSDQHTMYDPSTGENVVRVLQTEEFAPQGETTASSRSYRQNHSSPHHDTGTSPGSGGNGPSGSSFYYRIVAQDFKERYDPFAARAVYVPITEPYLQEDGYRTESASPHHRGSGSGRDPGGASSKRSNIESSILHPWQVLTPSSEPMVSPNQKYVAGLSQDCELLVVLNDHHLARDGRSGRGEREKILWSTQRPYGTNGYAADHCFAVLKGSHLVVTVGKHPHDASGSSNGNTNRILWHSDARSDDHDSRHGYYEYEDEFGFWHKRQRSYLAQLDNDGALTVYSVWNVPLEEQHQKKHHPHLQKQFFSSTFSFLGLDRSGRGRGSHHHHSPRDLVLRAFVAAEDLWHGRIDANQEYGHLYSSGTSITYKRCTYSTSSPFGCYRLGRRVTQVALECFWKMQAALSRINHLADAWLDLIYEEDDLFYDLKESIWRNTNAFGSKVAALQARWVRKLLETFRATFSTVSSSR